MLSAHTKQSKLVTLLNRTRDQIEILKNQCYFCPVCKQPLLIKNGKVKIPHFAHYSNNNCCIYSEGETYEHLALKQFFVNWCEKDAIPYELEKYLPEVNQRPDLLVGKIALEIQCSPLSVKRLVERTKNYQKYGYLPIWICGKKLFSNQQALGELGKNLCSYTETIGFYIWQADIETEELTLYFHMEEDWKKRIYYSKKSWTFYEDILLDIFDFPYKSNFFVQRKFEIGKLIQDYYFDLNRKLTRRDEQIRNVQSVLYNNRCHLLELPSWFYYPGIRIFCCRGSDLLLKLKIWNWVQFFDQNVFELIEFERLIQKQIVDRRDLFYEFPNVSMEEIKKYCSNQLIMSLIDCKYLITVSNGWKIVAGDKKLKQTDLNQWMKSIENKCVISAIPQRSVIR